MLSGIAGPDLPRPISGVYEGDAGWQASGVYPGGARCRQGVVRLLWHEHVHNQPLQQVFDTTCSSTV